MRLNDVRLSGMRLGGVRLQTTAPRCTARLQAKTDWSSLPASTTLDDTIHTRFFMLLSHHPKEVKESTLLMVILARVWSGDDIAISNCFTKINDSLKLIQDKNIIGVFLSRLISLAAFTLARCTVRLQAKLIGAAYLHWLHWMIQYIEYFFCLCHITPMKLRKVRC